ncbi:MAG: nitroreductase family protein [Candidatus Moraniibacteriota bacterium]|jgi:Nitroreductase family
MKIRLNNLNNIIILPDKVIVDTNDNIISIADVSCINVIKKLLDQKLNGGNSVLVLNKKQLNNESIKLLLKENIFLDTEEHSIKEVLQLFNFFSNPNINNIEIPYKQSLEITKSVHKKNIPWISEKKPTVARYSHRDFSDKKITKSSLKKIAKTSYGLLWQQKTSPFISHTPIASAGALNPLRLFFIIKEQEIFKVVYFNKESNTFDSHFQLSIQDFKDCLVEDLHPGCLNAPYFALIASDLSFICAKYGYRGLQYSILEGGALSHQLSASMLKEQIYSVHLGGFYEERIQNKLNFQKFSNTVPLLLIAFGYKK